MGINQLERKQELLNKVQINKTKEGVVIFNIKNGKEEIGVAKLTLKKGEGEDGKKYYKLEDINSFDKERGIATAILRKIGEFIEGENAVGIMSLYVPEKQSLFEKNGWVEFGTNKGSLKTMVYNM